MFGFSYSTHHPMPRIYCCFIHFILFLLYPRSTKLKGGGGGGVHWFHLARLSVCGQNRVRCVSSTILAVSISYLHIILTNSRRGIYVEFCEKSEFLAFF